MEEYLAPTYVIDSDNEQIIGKARSLVEGVGDLKERAVALFYFVRDKIRYNLYLPKLTLEVNRASVTLERGEGYCVQKAILLAALARAIGIPSRLGFADIRNYILPEHLLKQRKGINLFVYHGYTELYLNDKWVKAVTAFDLETCEKHGLIPVEFDGEHDALLQKYNRHGQLHVQYEKEHGHFSDFPLDRLIQARKEAYGDVDLNEW